MGNSLEETGPEMKHETEHGMGHRMTGKAAGFRFVGPRDVDLILRFTRELANYGGTLDQVVATGELLNQWPSEKEEAEVILGMRDGETVGFALFFYNSSTFLDRFNIYLGDLYVHPKYRGQGFGIASLNRLATIAVERGCGCLEWWCLGWNKLGIDLYPGTGAQAMSDWAVYRIDREQLEAMAVAAQGQHVRRSRQLLLKGNMSEGRSRRKADWEVYLY